MIKIPHSKTSYGSVKPSLSGLSYTFTYRYNTLSETWSLDIYLNDTPIINGETLTPYSFLFYGQPIPNFTHGKLILLPNIDNARACGINNIGIGKEYTLYYISNEEYENVG